MVARSVAVSPSRSHGREGWVRGTRAVEVLSVAGCSHGFGPAPAVLVATALARSQGFGGGAAAEAAGEGWHFARG